METQHINIKPSILSYTSAIEYLQDHYQYRKFKDPSFSYEIWAAELGLKSRSSLRLVCNGKKNITQAFINNFSVCLKLTLSEKEHFLLISKMTNSKTAEFRSLFLDKVHEKREIPHTEITAEMYTQFLSHPIAPVVQVLTGFQDFEANVSNLSKALNVKKEQVVKSLDLLEQCQLVQKETNEKSQDLWKTSITPFKVKDEAQSQPLYKYHHQTLSEAQQALLLEDELKRFRSVLMALDVDNFKDIKNDLEDFLRKLKSKYGTTEIKNKKLCKINFQIYPVTDTIDS